VGFEDVLHYYTFCTTIPLGHTKHIVFADEVMRVLDFASVLMLIVIILFEP